MAAGGKFITRWLMLSLGLIILVVYFAVYAPASSSYISRLNNLSGSDVVEQPVVVNEPMIEQGIMRGGRGKKDHEVGALDRLRKGPEDVEVITLEMPDVKPTRLMPVRPAKTAVDGANAADVSTSTADTSTTTETAEADQKATLETSTTDTATTETSATSATSTKETAVANTGEQKARKAVEDPGELWF